MDGVTIEAPRAGPVQPGRIVHWPQAKPAGGVRAKLAGLGLSEADIADAVAWALSRK